MNEPSFTTPKEAEAAFYAAFEATNLEAMMLVWEAGNGIVCVHPLGPPLQGMSQVRASWQQIFANPARLRFQISTLSTHVQGGLAVNTVFEHITVLGAAEQPRQPVLSTNVYRQDEKGDWRMILHHATPTPPIGDAPSAKHMH
ncbi:MAG: nuclear transport factor 2 family protein [Gammaproteobacteria bacterium]|nr:nuclear transport factor 2 family protein [Gammaproteobacteria bacterium]MCP5459337.1 nuclear transport factor 2 family protein [Gammaproteobacteria bacterium]